MSPLQFSSPRLSVASFFLLFLSGLLAVSALSAQETRTIRGTLAKGDRAFEDGAWLDSYRILLKDKQKFQARLQSGDFDSQLILVRPDGKFSSKATGEKNGAPVSIGTRAFAPDDGTFEILVAAQQPGEGGGYTLEITAPAANLDAVRGPDGEILDPEDFAEDKVSGNGAESMPDRESDSAPWSSTCRDWVRLSFLPGISSTRG